jgi:hypothetical protein
MARLHPRAAGARHPCAAPTLGRQRVAEIRTQTGSHHEFQTSRSRGPGRSVYLQIGGMRLGDARGRECRSLRPFPSPLGHDGGVVAQKEPRWRRPAGRSPTDCRSSSAASSAIRPRPPSEVGRGGRRGDGPHGSEELEAHCRRLVGARAPRTGPPGSEQLEGAHRVEWCERARPIDARDRRRGHEG